MLPTGKMSPELWLEVSVPTSQLSLVVGAVQVTTAVHNPVSAARLMSADSPDSAGTSSSVTVTRNEAVLVLSSSSAAV